MMPRGVICNMASPLLSSGNGDLKSTPPLSNSENTANSSLRFILDRLAVERSLFEHLRAGVEAKPIVVERRRRFGTDLDLLLDLSERLEGVAEI